MIRKTKTPLRKGSKKAEKAAGSEGLRRKRRIQRAGRRAETLCAWLLRAKGYRLLARNWRCRSGEIDIIAHRRGVLVFVEVKYRPTGGLAQQAVRPRQWQRIGRAASSFCAARADAQGHVWRFDLMACAARQWPKHIEDVWRSR